MDKIAKSYSFEYNVFKWLLIGSLAFWCYRIVTHLMFDDAILDLTIDFIVFLITIGIVAGLRYYPNYNHLILAYCIILMTGYVHFWYRLGGLNGPISYGYFSLIAFFITILPKRTREITAIVFCGFTVLLSLNIPDPYFNLVPKSPTTEFLLPMDYVMNSIIVSIIVVLAKKNFDMERTLLEKNSVRVQKMNEQQQEKTAKLLNQQEEIKSIKENLELLVKERTNELELKNKQLEEYAFHNAHLVRKPLSNIQGLISILEMENKNLKKEDLESLKENVRKLDLITRKINLILQ